MEKVEQEMGKARAVLGALRGLLLQALPRASPTKTHGL